MSLVRVALAGLACLAGVLCACWVLLTTFDPARAALWVIAGALVAAFITPD